MSTPAELLEQALAKLQTANRIDGSRNSYRKDMAVEYQKVIAYLQSGPRPSGVTSDMGMGLMLTEDARRALNVVVPPDPIPEPGKFGGLLPARLPQSTGAITNVATVAALTNALNTVPNGSIVNITSNLNFNGAQFNITRVASPFAPITITCNPGVNLQNFWPGLYVQGAYLRIKGLDIGGPNTGDGIKVDGSGHDIEIEGCYFHDMKGNGIVKSSPAHHVQVWNCRFYAVGQFSNGYDHGFYWSYTAPGDVVANALCWRPWGYGGQFYPNDSGLIVTCCTFDGGQINSPQDTQGGVVVGGSSGAKNNVFVGLIVTNAPNAPALHADGDLIGANNLCADSLSFGNAGGDFAGAPGLTITHCTHADPLYVNRTTDATANFHLKAGSPAKGYIDAARYGYVPPLDIDGKARVTADAGCYAA